MGLVKDALLGISRLRRSLENPSTPLSAPDDWLFDALGSFRASSGVNINRETALTYDAYFRCIALISGDVAKLPLYVCKRTADKGELHDEEHPAYAILRDKFTAEHTALIAKRVLTFHAMSEGNGYGYILRDKSPKGGGRPLEVWPMSPVKTYPVREGRRLWYVTEVDHSPRKIPAEDVLHIRGLSFDGLAGYQAVAKMRETLGMGIAAENFGSIFFRNNARPNVVIRHPGKLKPEARSNLRESWERMHSGLENAHRTAILDEGMDVTPLMHNARDSQLLELKGFTRVQVCNFFGVPPHKVGDNSRTSYNSLEQENESYVDDGGGLGYWLAAWQAESWDKLLTEEEKKTRSHLVKFELRKLLRANVQVRTTYYCQLLDRGVFNANEVRAEEGFNPREGGDQYRVALNTKDANAPDPETDRQQDDKDDDQVGGKKKPPAIGNKASLPLLGLRGGKKPGRDADQALQLLAGRPDVDEGQIAVDMPVDEEPPADPSTADLGGAKKRYVRVATLTATQPRVGRDLVAKFIGNPDADADKPAGSHDGNDRMPAGLPGDRPYVVEADGTRYVWDGHHRLTADQLRGVDKVKVYYVKES